MKWVRFESWIFASIVVFATSAALAQTEPPPPPPTATAAAEPPPPILCEPKCRAGFTCVKGQCVSLCEPACPSNMQCSATAECVSLCNPPCPDNMQCNASAQCEPKPAPPPQQTQAPVAQRPVQPPPGQAQPWGYQPYPGEPPPPPRPPNPTVHFHDGFYMRLGVGIGAIGATVSAQDSGSSSSSRNNDLQVTGLTIPVEFAIGGTPAPGVVIGGGVYGLHVPSAKYTLGRGDFVKEETADYSAVSMVGPFIDIYPDPHHGFHLQAAPCFATVTPGKSDTIVTGDVSGSGFGAMAGLGVENWVGEQWGLGVLARVQYVSATLEDENNKKYDFKMLAPSILLTATLH